MAIDVVHPALLVTPIEPLDPDVDYTMVVHSLFDLEGHSSSDSRPLVFHTSDAITPAPPVSLGYDDVAPIFESCVSCHGSHEPALGLDLSSAAAVRRTAIGVAAHDVMPSVSGSLSARVTAALVGLPRIDRQSPARSYLLYTMVDDVHITGAPMPPSGELASDADLERLQAWIQAGAPGL